MKWKPESTRGEQHWKRLARLRLRSTVYLAILVGIVTYIPGSLTAAALGDGLGGGVTHTLIRLSILPPLGLAALLLWRRRISPLVAGYILWISIFLSAGYAAAYANIDLVYLGGAILANVPVFIVPALLLFWDYRHTLINCLIGYGLNILFALSFNTENFVGYIVFWLIMLPIAIGAVFVSAFRYHNARKLFFSNWALRRTRRELSNQNARLTAAHESKVKFISLLAHDLGNQFSQIIFTTQMLDSALAEDNREVLGDVRDLIRDATFRTNERLGKLLEWSLFSGRDLKMNPENVSLTKITQDVLANFRARREQKKIEVKRSYPEGKGHLVHADTPSVSLILSNLLDNALKYSYPESEIILDIRPDGSDMVYIISDRGVGIPPAIRENLLEPGKKRPATAGTAGEQGPGMGLLICQELVAKNNGRLELESYPGRGTRAILRLPRPSRDEDRPEIPNFQDS